MDIATASFADIAARGRRLAELEPKPLDMVDTFRIFAEFANLHDKDCDTQATMLALVDMITRHLTSVQAADWWSDLRHCMSRQEEVKGYGPRAGEEDIDWDKRVTEALQFLAGLR